MAVDTDSLLVVAASTGEQALELADMPESLRQRRLIRIDRWRSS